MTQQVFIFKVSFMKKDGSYDYTTIVGVYSKREDAVKAAKEKIAQQKNFWDGSYIIKHNGNSVRLMSKDGFCKWYDIEEQVVK